LLESSRRGGALPFFLNNDRKGAQVKRTLLPLLVLFALTALPARGEEARDLLTFLDAGKSAALPATPGTPGIAAERQVQVDLGTLAGNPRLELLDGTVYETRQTGTERRGSADFTWRGKVLLAGKEVGQMTLTVVAVPLSALTGAFYFTDASNLELLAKVLDFGDRIAFSYGTLNFCGGLDNHAF
jgi:hypothetical protein